MNIKQIPQITTLFPKDIKPDGSSLYEKMSLVKANKLSTKFGIFNFGATGTIQICYKPEENGIKYYTIILIISGEKIVELKGKNKDIVLEQFSSYFKRYKSRKDKIVENVLNENIFNNEESEFEDQFGLFEEDSQGDNILEKIEKEKIKKINQSVEDKILILSFLKQIDNYLIEGKYLSSEVISDHSKIGKAINRYFGSFEKFAKNRGYKKLSERGRDRFKEYFEKNKGVIVDQEGYLKRKSFFDNSEDELRKWFIKIQRFYPTRKTFCDEFGIKIRESGANSHVIPMSENPNSLLRSKNK